MNSKKRQLNNTRKRQINNTEIKVKKARLEDDLLKLSQLNINEDVESVSSEESDSLAKLVSGMILDEFDEREIIKKALKTTYDSKDVLIVLIQTINRYNRYIKNIDFSEEEGLEYVESEIYKFLRYSKEDFKTKNENTLTAFKLMKNIDSAIFKYILMKEKEEVEDSEEEEELEEVEKKD